MIRRLAYLSFHTTPLAQPGSGDAGGMNVYVDELARTMVERGVEVDVFTRRSDPVAADEVEVVPGYRVVHITAGPEEPMPTSDLAPWVEPFAFGVVKWAEAADRDYDVVHSHYWLSGWAGVLVKGALEVPLANSFHTLGRVKDASRRPGQAPESLLRIAAETEVIGRSDCVIASTPAELDDLVAHYGASPERLCLSPPGVDHRVFRPFPRQEAWAELEIEYGPLLAAVGRIQPLKGFDLAVETLAMLRSQHPTARLIVIGGPSGPQGSAELSHLRALAHQRGLGDATVFLPPQPHGRLATFYNAVDVLLVPSRSESFGLVAMEAQACGLPVVAARVGGLAYAVADGESGYLIDGWDPADFAEAAGRVLADEALARRLGEGAVRHAETFSWDATADRLLELYRGISGA